MVKHFSWRNLNAFLELFMRCLVFGVARAICLSLIMMLLDLGDCLATKKRFVETFVEEPLWRLDQYFGRSTIKRKKTWDHPS